MKMEKETSTSKKQKLKALRKTFREGCLKRDGGKCAICGFKPYKKENIEQELNVHHITDRKILPNDGYSLSNGITLCVKCHEKAEVFHFSSGQNSVEGFLPADLYAVIGSCFEKALKDSSEL